MDGVFLSERVGAEKPNIAFFEKVFQEIHADDVCQPGGDPDRRGLIDQRHPGRDQRRDQDLLV